MAEVGNIRSYIENGSGSDPDTEDVAYKVDGFGIFIAGPTITGIRSIEGASWFVVYDLNSAGAWVENESERREPPETYEYRGTTYSVPDWPSEIET